MNYQQILVAIDLSNESQIILKKAQHLAKLHQATLNLIHIDQSFLDTYDGLTDINEKEFEEKLHHESVLAIKELLEQSQTSVNKYFVSSGTLDEEILKIINNHQIDLLVLGHHKSSWFRQLLLSSSEAIIKTMPCDIVLLKI